MKQYAGKTCPYCKGILNETDEIVVCSDCDMPHHKECWVENQGCTTFGCTGAIQSIDQSDESDIAGKNNEDIEIDFFSSDVDFSSAYCPKCGSSHEPTDLSCKHCGQSFSTQSNRASSGSSGVSEDYVSSKSNHQAPDSVEDNDGERSLVGPNYEYYRQRFSVIRDSSKTINWNWSAFLFAPYWCIYRKMYGIGAAILGGTFILSFLNTLGRVIVLAGRVAFGIYANFLYLQQIERKAATARGMDEHMRSAYFQKSCGTNALAVVLSLIGYVIIAMVMDS